MPTVNPTYIVLQNDLCSSKDASSLRTQLSTLQTAMRNRPINATLWPSLISLIFEPFAGIVFFSFSADTKLKQRFGDGSDFIAH